MQYVAYAEGAKMASGAAKETSSNLFGIWDTWNSNPQMRKDHANELKKKSDEAYNNDMEELKKTRSAFDQEIAKRHAAADMQMSELVKSNNTELKTLQDQFNRDEASHGMAMKMMVREHAEKMKELRSEGREAQERAEREHRMKMSEAEEEHRKEKEIAQEKMDAAKREGSMKIALVEEEKQKIMKERSDELEKYTREMNEMAKNHQEERKKHNAIIGQKKMEMIGSKRDQLKIESEKILESMRNDINLLLAVEIKQNGSHLVEKLIDLFESVKTVKCLMDTVQTELTTIGDEVPEITPGQLSTFDDIKRHKTLFDNRVARFRKNVVTSSFTDAKLYEICMTTVSDFEKIMDKQDMKLVCHHLPKAVENQDFKKIKYYADMASKLNNQFSQEVQHLAAGFSNVSKTYAIDRSNQAAIQN